MPPTFYSSYLAGNLSAHPLYPVGFGTPEERLARTRAAAARPLSPSLLTRLQAQNARLPPSAARDRNLRALADHGAAVITGQQVGLFLGPLFTLYKAASAVAVARLLEAESGVRCAPVFWLQTEDHDFAEVAGCRLARGDGSLARPMLGGDDDLPARASVAHRTLGADVAGALDALDEALSDEPHAAEVCALVRRHYRPGTSWAGAFAGTLAELFADEGLIVLDPREEAVARLAAPVLRRSLVEHEAIERALQARGQALAAAGLDEQVRARPGMPLPFFHVGDAQGGRHRLKREGDRFAVEGTEQSFTLPELLAILDAEPLRFSTSALLRPIVQDSLLPTAAYVGGPAEVSYFAQLQPLYPLFELSPPLLVPRARFRLIPSQLKKLLDKLGLRPADVEQPREALLARVAGARADAQAPSPAWLSELEQRLDILAKTAPALDPGLVRAVERTRATVVRALSRLERRYTRALVARDEVVAARVERLQRWLFPDGEPQERVHAFCTWAARVGPRPLLNAILGAVDPLHPQPKDLEL